MLFGGLGQTLFEALFNFLNDILSFVFYPINQVIYTYLPDVTDALLYMNRFINIIGSYLRWCTSYFGFYDEVWAIVSLLIVAIISIPIYVHSIKLAIRWYIALKP